jgi:hypothetical protein
VEGDNAHARSRPQSAARCRRCLRGPSFLGAVCSAASLWIGNCLMLPVRMRRITGPNRSSAGKSAQQHASRRPQSVLIVRVPAPRKRKIAPSPQKPEHPIRSAGARPMSADIIGTNIIVEDGDGRRTLSPLNPIFFSRISSGRVDPFEGPIGGTVPDRHAYIRSRVTRQAHAGLSVCRSRRPLTDEGSARRVSSSDPAARALKA